MSNHAGPEGVASDEQRCCALVKGTNKTIYWNWTRYDRRCSRKANQTRNGIAVCYIHAMTDELTPWVESATLPVPESEQ